MRWIVVQNISIVLVFLAAFAAVIFLGTEQGKKTPLQTDGVALSEKTAWDEALPNLPAGEDPTVYVTKSGTKYHLSSDCKGLINAKEIIGTPLSDALKQGKTLCALCAEEG